jgi:hypothetical protein
LLSSEIYKLAIYCASCFYLSEIGEEEELLPSLLSLEAMTEISILLFLVHSVDYLYFIRTTA